MANPGKKILVIDDEITGRMLLTEILGAMWTVVSAESGSDGLDKALTEHPDIVLLDIMLPDMDGYEVCRQLKQDPRTKDIPVIFVTARIELKDEIRGLEVGGVDFVRKPFSPAIIRARVKNHLDLKGYRDMLEAMCALDGLTGIPNQRRFRDTLDREWRRAILLHNDVSIVMLDIDQFSEFNQHFGYSAGNELLKRIAMTLKHRLRRPDDIAARWRDEEFACLLPETNSRAAWTIANSLHCAIKDIKLMSKEQQSELSVSMAVNTAQPTDQDEVDAFLKATMELMNTADGEVLSASPMSADDKP